MTSRTAMEPQTPATLNAAYVTSVLFWGFFFVFCLSILELKAQFSGNKKGQKLLSGSIKHFDMEKNN